MAVSDWLKPGMAQKERVKVITVDPASRRVEAILKDGAVIQIAVWEVPAFFVWPEPEQWWTIYRDSGTWVLGDRMEVPEEGNKQIETLQPGEAKLSSDTIFTPSGKRVLIAGGLQTKRIGTGTVAGSGTALVTLTWAVPFADTNYTVTAVIAEGTADTTLSVSKVASITPANIVVRVVNADSSSHVGTVHAIAIAD